MAVRRQAPYRADDIWATPDDGNRYEVIAGRLFVAPPLLEAHQRAVGGLFGLVWDHVRAHGLGRVYFAPTSWSAGHTSWWLSTGPARGSGRH